MKRVARTAAQMSTLPIPDRDHIQGPIDGPIKLLEYGDYECPYCGEAYPVVKEIQERLGSRLCFAFRNFPLSNSHPHAEHAAEAAEAEIGRQLARLEARAAVVPHRRVVRDLLSAAVLDGVHPYGLEHVEAEMHEADLVRQPLARPEIVARAIANGFPVIPVEIRDGGR